MLPLCLPTTRATRLTGQLSLIALLAGLGAGCSSMSPFNGPAFTGSTANQKAIIAGAPGQAAPGAYGAPMGGVQSSDLPPPGGVAAPAYAAAPAAPQPYTPPTPYAASGMPTPLGQVNTPAARPANPPGQQLAQLGAAPTSLNDQAARIGGGSAGFHTVQPGDTMYNIARRNGVSVNELIAANGGSSVAKLGARVVVPGGGSAPAQPRVQLASVDPQSMPAPAVAPAAAVPAGLPPPAAAIPDAAPAQPPLAQAVAAVQPAAAEPPPAAAVPATDQAASGPGGFRWPVRGRVISGFGKKPDGERNDGINLAVPEGTPVKAAEDGTVIYAGNELKSYGNLVLVRHEGGWVSAYAHNGALNVKRGEPVKRGQIVATSGMSGGVTTPQVHFELRKDATPVDPLQHLAEG